MLKKLETLDLSFNSLNESIMELVGALPSIKNLTLAGNLMGGPFPRKELSLLPNLEVLDLRLNLLRSPVTFTTQVVSDTHADFYVLKLKTLNLAGNIFDKGILKSLVAFPALRSLYLSDNPIKELNDTVLTHLSKLEVLQLRNTAINASFPNQGLCKMNKLRELDLSFNYFRGTLDACLENLTSLRTLDLSRNFLSGNPTPFIAHLASIEDLSISYNNFEGLFSFNILGNFSKLKSLQIGYMNSKTFQVETENPPWVASFQLEQLSTSYCGVNLPTKVIPTFLSNQSGLRFIDLMSNNLVGKFPGWLLVNNPNLEVVLLHDNSFTGPLELPFGLNHHMDQMHSLYLSNNHFHGKLPNNIGSFFPSLVYFDVSNNMFDGPIPASIGEMSSLVGLFLGNNNFSGNVPKHILNGCFSLKGLMMDNNQLNGTLQSVIRKLRLQILTASRNNFEGAISDELCQHKLLILDLSQNKFSGALPSCFKVPNYLFLQENNLTGTIPEAINNYTTVAIDLSDNKFTGTIPDSVYGLWSLRFLLLAGNELQGQLSSQICQLKKINILDLSRNNFTGSIPTCFSSMSFGNFVVDRTLYGYDLIRQFNPRSDFAEVQLITKSSCLSYKSDTFQNMSELDLSSNQLTGEIPRQIGDLHYLHSLNLSHNHLNGPIPESFHKLENIESLDLSNNNLSGQIPLQLQDLNYLAIFNVSYNNLSGKAPDEGQFGTFGENNYKGNPYLTWNNCNKGIPTPPPPPTLLHDEDKDSAIDLTTFYWSFALSYLTVLIMLVTILWINPHWRRRWFYFVKVCLHKCFGQFLEDAFY
ncbi:Leucine-rich repeat receptor-like serine/threonine-protein kinase, partial [Mucuna pruriens]